MSRIRFVVFHIDSHTTQTVTHHTGLHFPSSIALITQLSPITRSPESYYTHYITPTQFLFRSLSKYCLAFITLLVLALPSHSVFIFCLVSSIVLRLSLTK